jgi:hypothetical protein
MANLHPTCLGASIQDVIGRATDSELAGNSRKVSSAGILQRLRHEPADRRGAWRQWLFWRSGALPLSGL